MQMFKVILVLGLVALAMADENDIVRQMPDCDVFPYNAYSGYLDVDSTKALHYVFV